MFTKGERQPESLCRANDDVKGSEDQVVDASKRDLFCQISCAFCLCAPLRRPLVAAWAKKM